VKQALSQPRFKFRQETVKTPTACRFRKRTVP